ncbi:unnamed protein product [Rotaria magnacalcarata]|nr:unnamed protein product [Rotaria magnacalcarata]CAF1666308.1 unnamed protein product [Rotaria magnacalcarata]
MEAPSFQIIGLVCLTFVQIYGQSTSSFSSTMPISASDTSISSASLYQNSTNTMSSSPSYAASVVTSNSETLITTSMIQNNASQTGLPSAYGTSAVTSNSGTVGSTGASNASSTPSTAMMSSSVTSSMIQSSGSQTGSSASYATSVVTSNSGTVGSTGTANTSSIQSTAIMAPSVTSSMMQSDTSISSSLITSASITTSSINTSISLVCKYIVASSSALATGNTTNNTYLTSVQSMVIGSFNLTGFNIVVTRIEIQATAKAVTTQYNMFIEILFRSSRSDCDSTCIKSSALPSIPTQNIILPGADGSSVTVNPISSVIFVDNTPNVIPTTTVALIMGESPPGTAAQLGMGLGISFVGIILIIEIIYLYRRYGCNQSTREADYALPTYNYQL